jgi:hypothetical protein
MQDMISVYFLSTEKKSQVDALVAAGLAVKQETIADSVSEMSLRPTEQLLALCPLQVCRVFLPYWTFRCTWLRQESNAIFK